LNSGQSTTITIKRRLAFLAALACGVVAVACAGSDASSPTADKPASPTAASDVAGAVATPEMLPVTPVSIQYEVADPSFEALPGAREFSGARNGSVYGIVVP
jgi:hypothetical protein